MFTKANTKNTLFCSVSAASGNCWCFDKQKLIAELARELDQFVRNSAAGGKPLHNVEQRVLGSVLELGRCYIDQFIGLQGDGDLGLTLATDEGK